MSLELKIESLKARGELKAEERDRLLARLAHPAAEPTRTRTWLSPLRIFLLGVLFGAGISQAVWWIFGPLGA